MLGQRLRQIEFNVTSTSQVMEMLLFFKLFFYKATRIFPCIIFSAQLHLFSLPLVNIPAPYDIKHW